MLNLFAPHARAHAGRPHQLIACGHDVFRQSTFVLHSKQRHATVDILHDLIQCSEAEVRRQKQERAKLDMLAANERQMQLKASPCLCLLQ